MSACHMEHGRSLSVAWVQVKYASLPNFEEREEDFRADSVVLRRRFTEDGVRPAPPRLCCDVLAPAQLACSHIALRSVRVAACDMPRQTAPHLS